MFFSVLAGIIPQSLQNGGGHLKPFAPPLSASGGATAPLPPPPMWTSMVEDSWLRQRQPWNQRSQRKEDTKEKRVPRTISVSATEPLAHAKSGCHMAECICTKSGLPWTSCIPRPPTDNVWNGIRPNAPEATLCTCHTQPALPLPEWEVHTLKGVICTAATINQYHNRIKICGLLKPTF